MIIERIGMNLYTYSFTPQFADTDSAGIVHFSNIFRYIEAAEHAYLISLGFPINPSDPGCLQWPRVACSAEFMRPIEAFQTLKINLTVKRVGSTSVTWHWEIHSQNQTYARGELKTVCCRINNNRIEPGPLPEKLHQILSA